jgi:DNA-binding MarR family transcriptional regulator
MPHYKDSDRYQVIWLIRRLFRALGRASDELLSPRGLSAADRAVMEFLYPDRALSVPEIARRYSVSRQHVQVTVNSLIDKGLVTTSENPRHKRSPLVQLSRRGRGLFASILEGDREAIDALFETVAAKDARITRATLQSLLDQLTEEDRQ